MTERDSESRESDYSEKDNKELKKQKTRLNRAGTIEVDSSCFSDSDAPIKAESPKKLDWLFNSKRHSSVPKQRPSDKRMSNVIENRRKPSGKFFKKRVSAQVSKIINQSTFFKPRQA